MLEEWPNSGTLDFWARHPLDVHGMLLEGTTLLRHIWDAERGTPPWYFWSIINSLEPFLHARGYGTLHGFWDKLCVPREDAPGGICGLPFPVSGILPGKSLSDSRFQIAEAVPKWLTHWFPGSTCSLLHWRSRPGSSHAGFAFSPQQSFSGPIPPFDFSVPLGRMVENLPTVLGAPAFDAVSLSANSPNFSQLTWSDAFRVVGEALYRGRELWGRVVSFSSFCRFHDWELGGLEVPNRLVILFERDFHCPVRKRLVIPSGSICGAPLYLFTLRLDTSGSRKTHPPVSAGKNSGETFAEKSESRFRALLENYGGGRA